MASDIISKRLERKVIYPLSWPQIDFNMRNIHRLLVTILFSVITTGLCSAQDYLLTTSGDSLSGSIKMLNYGTDKKVQIAQEGKKKKDVYPLFKVKAFSLANEMYHPVKGPNGYVFMKLLKKGYLSLYAFQPQHQNNYDGLFLLKRDGNGMEVPNLTFKKSMKRYLDDCPTVADKIESDILNKRDINEIVDQYNACIVTRSNTIAQPSGPAPAAATKTAPTVERSEKVGVWETLESKVKDADIAEKENALDMIAEIKNKVNSNQRVPNFLIEGLKAALGDSFKSELDAAMASLN